MARYSGRHREWFVDQNTIGNKAEIQLISDGSASVEVD